MSNMDWLMEWYQANCNGSWEKAEGITMVTTDGPGWQITISLEGTGLADSKFSEVLQEAEDENDWYSARISDPKETKELGGRCFIAACGPGNVNDVIAVFKAFAESERDLNAVA